MYTCNDETLNKQMETLYEEYRSIDSNRIKHLKIYDSAYKAQKYIFVGSLVGGFILFRCIFDIPQLYLAGCFLNPLNILVKELAKTNKDFCEQELDAIKSEIVDLEYKMMTKSNLNTKTKEDMGSIEDLKQSYGVKLSKHHDFKYSEEEAFCYKMQNDLRYEIDGNHKISRKDRFNSELTGDYENPVFVLMDNKGKVLTKRPKYKRENN